MNPVDKILEIPMTLTELERELHIISTHLPNSSGETRELRLKKKLELENQIGLIKNDKPEDIILIDESPRTIEMDTYDISTLEFKTVKNPRTANEIMAERKEHKFSSSLYHETIQYPFGQNTSHPMEGVFLGLAGCY